MIVDISGALLALLRERLRHDRRRGAGGQPRQIPRRGVGVDAAAEARGAGEAAEQPDREKDEQVDEGAEQSGHGEVLSECDQSSGISVRQSSWPATAFWSDLRRMCVP